MAEAFDPYAPPAAALEPSHELGEVARKGKLVRMDREGRLPQRCVGCNAPALPGRVSRTLYWSPWRWRLFMIGTPVLLIALAIAGVEPAGFIAFLLVPVLVIAHLIVRKRLDLDIGLCARHTKFRRVLYWAGVTSMLLLCVSPVFTGSYGAYVTANTLWLGLLVMLAFAVAFLLSPAQRVAIAELDRKHVLLKHTGAAFRASLPEAGAD
jgi:hypothetical protein